MKRVVAALTALLLAVAGGAVLLAYVARADQRAMAGMEPASVLVVDALVPKGTAADQLGKSVQSKELPALRWRRGRSRA